MLRVFAATSRPRAIVLTHVHPDHAGSASDLARMWDVAVYVLPGELPLPPSGRIIGALAGVERRWMFPSGQDGLSPIDPDAGVPGLPDWQVIPTPGHTPGHLALFREADRALIAGDAVLTVNLNSLGDALSLRHTLGGPPRFATWNWRAATESVSELARLEPGVLVPGHGRPMACPVLAPALTALRAPQQPCQRWQRGLIRAPQADGAGPQLLRLQSPSPLTAPRCSRAVALLSANGVRRPGGAPAAPRRQSLHSGALPRRGPAPVRPRPRPRSGPRRGSSPVTPRCAPRAARGAGG